MQVTHRAVAIAALVLCEQVMAQVPTSADAKNESPIPAATVSEGKPRKKTTTDNIALGNFLKQEGFGVVKLERENLGDQKVHKNQPKHLIIDVEVNRVSASLMVDTGTPTTNIARDKLQKFGVAEQETSSRVTSPLGSASDKFYGIAKLNTLAMGNCVVQDVPVLIDAIPFIGGVLGSDDMRRIGAVLDCGEPALYYAPHGPSDDVSSKLEAILRSNAFTQVPIRLGSDHRLQVACSIDGIPSTIVIDTGSLVTCVDRNVAIKAGIRMKRTKTVLLGSGGASALIRTGRVKQFLIGKFEIRNADISFVDLKETDFPSAYILGIGELVSHRAIIDLGGLNMYLRHPR